MSGIGEFAYTLLLGWMRGVVDWAWSLVAGTGNTAGWQWFLSQWKLWLLVLVVGGLVVDWLMWVVRWRPYRVFFSRLRRAPVAEGPLEEEAWDDGIGYYEPEIAMDVAPEDWTENTFATLSEIDPDWAGDVIIDEDTPLYDPDFDPAHVTGFYEEAYDEPPLETFEHLSEAARHWTLAQPEEEYMEPSPEETQPFIPQENLEESAFEETPDMPRTFWKKIKQNEQQSADANAYAPYYEDEPYMEEEPAPDPYAAYARPVSEPEREPEPEPEPQIPRGVPQFGRPGVWPGAQFPFVERQEPEEAVAPAAPEPYDPLFNPDAPPPAEEAPTPRRRRRRRMRESAYETWQPEDPIPQTQPSLDAASATAAMPSWVDVPPVAPEEAYKRPTPRPRNGTIAAYIPPDPLENTRPSRVVRPIEEELANEETGGKKKKPKKEKRPKKDKTVRTVTGKPAQRRGLMRFTAAQDEPIAGLPPMHLTDPFLPVVHPDDVDFDSGDGDYS